MSREDARDYLLERFPERFPRILQEGCGGGGERFDALSEYVKKRESGEGIESIMSLSEEGI